MTASGSAESPNTWPCACTPSTLTEGHAFGSLPITLYFGMIGGALLTVAIPFALVATTRTVVAAPWLTIGWRVGSSWLAAIALMLAALRFA